MKTIAIGDVHGCLGELQDLLTKCKYEPTTDKLYLLGDLVDRGPDSAGVIAFARRLSKLYGAECVKGNHDDKHVRFRRHYNTEKATGKKNPMKFNDRNMAEHLKLTDEDVAWMEALPNVIMPPSLPGYACVHAGFNPFRGGAKNWGKECLFIRYIDVSSNNTVGLDRDLKQPENSIFWADLWTGPEKVLYGHCVHSYKEPLIINGTYGLDTGCCFGGRMTAAVFHDPAAEPEIVQVQAFDTYTKPFNI